MELARNHNILLILASFLKKWKIKFLKDKRKTNTYWAPRRVFVCLCEGRSLKVTSFEIADVPSARQVLTFHIAQPVCAVAERVCDLVGSFPFGSEFACVFCVACVIGAINKVPWSK